MLCLSVGLLGFLASFIWFPERWNVGLLISFAWISFCFLMSKKIVRRLKELREIVEEIGG
jgi:hypothetical protein